MKKILYVITALLLISIANAVTNEVKLSKKVITYSIDKNYPIEVINDNCIKVLEPDITELTKTLAIDDLLTLGGGLIPYKDELGRKILIDFTKEPLICHNQRVGVYSLGFGSTIIEVNKMNFGVTDGTIGKSGGVEAQVLDDYSDYLMAYYDFNLDPLGSTTCTDLVGNNDGVINAGSIGITDNASSYNHRSYFDDGIDTNNEGCTIDNSNVFNGLGTNFTIYSKVMRTDAGDTNGNIISLNGIILEHWSSNRLYAGVYFNDTKLYEIKWYNVFYPNIWYDVFEFYNGSDLCLSIGGTENCLEIRDVTNISKTATSYIGVYSTSRVLNGGIDNILIWNRSLTPQERNNVVNNLYKSKTNYSIVTNLKNITNPYGNFILTQLNFNSNDTDTPILRGINYSYSEEQLNVSIGKEETNRNNISTTIYLKNISQTENYNLTRNLTLLYDFDGDDYGKTTCSNILSDYLDGTARVDADIGICSDGSDMRGWCGNGLDEDGGNFQTQGCYLGEVTNLTFSHITVYVKYKMLGNNNETTGESLIQLGSTGLSFYNLGKTNSYRGRIIISGISDTVVYGVPNSITPNPTHFYDIFGWYNGSHICIEVDGEATCDVSTGTMSTFDGYGTIGAEDFGFNSEINGSIATLAVWNRSLIPQERQGIRNGSLLTNWTIRTEQNNSNPIILGETAEGETPPPSENLNITTNITLYLNNTQQDIVLTFGETFTVFYTDNASINITLTRNGTVIDNNSVQDLSAGYYNFTASTNQSTEVYFNNVTYFAEVLTLPPINENITVINLTLWLNNTQKNISLPDTETFTVYYLANTSYTVNLTKDGITIVNNTVQELEAGTYNFTAQIGGNTSIYFHNITYFAEVNETPPAPPSITTPRDWSYNITFYNRFYDNESCTMVILPETQETFYYGNVNISGNLYVSGCIRYNCGTGSCSTLGNCI